jgi:hypothetical protein
MPLCRFAPINENILVDRGPLTYHIYLLSKASSFLTHLPKDRKRYKVLLVRPQNSLSHVNQPCPGLTIHTKLGQPQ